VRGGKKRRRWEGRGRECDVLERRRIRGREGRKRIV